MTGANCGGTAMPVPVGFSLLFETPDRVRESCCHLGDRTSVLYKNYFSI